MGFTDDLADLISLHNLGGGNDAPSDILASFLLECLIAFNDAVASREKWHYGQIALTIEEHDG